MFFCSLLKGQNYIGIAYEYRSPTYFSLMEVGTEKIKITSDFIKERSFSLDFIHKSGFGLSIGKYESEYYLGYEYYFDAIYDIGGHKYVERGRTIPLRLSYAARTMVKPLHLFRIEPTIGVHFNKYSTSPSDPLLGFKEGFTSVYLGETFQSSYQMREGNFNHVERSSAFESRIKLSFRPVKFFEFYCALGKVWNQKELATADFSLVSSLRGTLVEGSTTTKGNHTYWGLGGRFFVDLAALKLKNKEEK